MLLCSLDHMETSFINTAKGRIVVVTAAFEESIACVDRMRAVARLSDPIGSVSTTVRPTVPIVDRNSERSGRARNHETDMHDRDREHNESFATLPMNVQKGIVDPHTGSAAPSHLSFGNQTRPQRRSAEA